MHYRDRLEHIHNIVQPADLGLGLRWVLGVHEHLGGILQDDRLIRSDEEPQEPRSQVLQGLFPFVRDRVIFAFEDSFDGFHRFPEAAPDVLVLLELPYDLQALEDIDDVVDPAPLDIELPRGLVQLDHDAVPALEALDELPAELLEALGLAIVAEDAPPQVLLALFFGILSVLRDNKDGPPLFEELRDGLLELLVVLLRGWRV